MSSTVRAASDASGMAAGGEPRGGGPALSSPAPSYRVCLLAVIALVLIGESCRLAQYLSRQAFWEDEVAVLVNVQHHPARELPFVKLESYDPASPVAAPPLFLWATQWMGNHFDYREYAVRLLPLICSMLAVPLVAHLAWRLTGPWAAVWATALFALSDPLLFQAGNVKPYSGDVFIAALIAWVAFAARPAASPERRLAAAAVVAAVAVWLSYPSIFAFAGVGLALAPALWKDRPRGIVAALVYGLPVVASFLAVYLLCMRAQREPNLDVYWVHLFPDYSKPLTIPHWLIGGTWEMFHFQMYPIGPIMLVAGGLGVWTLYRRADRSLLILLTAPVLLTLLASALAQYPWGGTRLTLFLTPFLFLLCGVGAASIPRRWWWGGAILAVVPAAMAGFAAYQLVVPRSKGNLRDAVRFLNEHRKPGEEVYLVGNQTLGAAPWYLPDRDPLTHAHLEQRAPIFARDFWLVISYEPRKRDENAPAFTQPNARVDESHSFHTSGADVLRFVPATGAATTTAPG